MTRAKQWIEALGLRPHPEGGYFRETYRSAELVARANLPERFTGDRHFATAIYFLLEEQDFSAFHRLKSDEMWHFYDGHALAVHVIDPDGTYSTIKVGKAVERGEYPQAVVPAGHFFAATVDDPAGYCLVGCTVAPGFDFADFEMPGRQRLIGMYPQHHRVIEKLTRV
jgi:predicted cupin superfamily sugar epimerase